MNKRDFVSIALIYKLYYYVGVTRPTDQETCAIVKTDCYSHIFPGEGGMSCHAGLQREASESVSRQRKYEENTGKSLCYSFHETEWVRQGK